MKLIALCLVLCACGAAPTEAVPTTQKTIQPSDNGQIQNPTSNGSPCQSIEIMVDGQLITSPGECNVGAHINTGDPLLDKGDPERVFIKAQER